VSEGDPLRHQFADHDMEERQDQVREQDGQYGRQVVLECIRQRLLAESADAQRRECDAELHRRDESRWIARDPQDVARPPVALVLEFHDARAAGGDEPVLGRDEEAVQQNQNGDPDELEEKCHGPARGPLVLGGISSSNFAASIGKGSARTAARTHVLC
jgi:hypothetical protein